MLALVALATLSPRTEAATLTYVPPTGNFFDNPASWDLGYMPGPSDTALYTYAPGGYYITYFASTNYALDKVEVKTFSGIGRSRFYSNPQFGASLLITNRLDIYTDGTTGSDLAGMTWEYFRQLDITNSTGTAVFEIGNRGVLQMVMGTPSDMGTARVDRIVSTNVESQLLIQGGELQTMHGVNIRQTSGNFSIGDTFPARWIMRSGTNTLSVANNGFMYLGQAVAASNSLIEISGSGTIYSNPSCDTIIGHTAEDCRMVIRDGARAYLSGNTDGSVGYFNVGNARRARMEISGSNTYVQLVNGFQVASGGRGTNAYFGISDGAVVVATAVSVGDFGLGVFAYASTTLVTGAGTWLSGSNMNIQIGQSAVANGHQFIVSSGAVVVTRNVLVSPAAGASNNHVQVRDGGVLRVNALSTRSGPIGYGTISNVAGVYQFRTPAPGISSGGGPITIENGTISFYEVINAPLLVNGTSLTNLTWTGDNTFELVRSTSTVAAAYTFDSYASTGNASNYQALALDDGEVRVTDLTIASEGRLQGSGIVNSETVAMNGLMTPGKSAGALTFNGDLSIGASANMDMEIGGLAAAAYDRVVVLGDVAVDGTLNTSLINGYEPNHGDDFTLIDNQGANPVTGTFLDMTNEHVFAAGSGFFRIRYNGGDGNDVTLEFESAGGGDMDGDDIPDWWETLHYNGPTNAHPTALASNGVNTVLEAWIADLNPTNVSSVFPPIALSNAPNGQMWIVLDPTSTARLYEVSATTNLIGAPASWSVNGVAQTGSGANVMFVVTNDVPHRNYRAGVRLP